MLAEQLDYVIGVDTHRDAHAYAVVALPGGGRTVAAELAAAPRGYREALALARRSAPGRRAWAIEGSGHYGAGLARFLLAQGERVLEIGRGARGPRGPRGRSDALDAVAAARAALAAERPGQPRRGGKRAALRALVVTREGALAVRRAGLNQLRALLVSAPEPLREQLRGLTRARLLRRCRELGTEGRDSEGHAVALSLRLCAGRVEAANREEQELAQAILALVRVEAPQLLARPGVGPISAAQLLISWSHPGRFPSEAAFARHGGSAPIPASSGQTLRHRLDRGGDRQLNRALHTIVLSRRKHHPETKAYVERRRSEGKSVREAIRCLKRYLARELFRLLEGTPLPT